MDANAVAKWVKGATDSSLQLRDYQIETWQRLWNRRRDDKLHRALIHLATGLGKTSVAAVDVLHYLKVENKKGRVLFVSHMNDISHQAEATFKRVDPNFTTWLYKSGRRLKDVDVTFATFQALYQNLDKIDPAHFTFIIWDEAHHIEAETFANVREHFQPEFELGLTATPERADGLDILQYFGRPVFVKSLAEGIAEGWLSAVDYHIVFDEAIKKAMNKGFEISTLKEIRELFAIRTRNEVISKEVLQRRHEIGLDKAKTIVFCQNQKAAEEMAHLLGGEVYHSNIKAEARQDIFKRFKNGKLQVICTVDMFNEGIDIPDARLVVFLRSTSSRTVFEQQLGRGLRRHPGKEKVTVLDFVANVERINFVRELGRHTEQHIHQRHRAGGYGSGDALPSNDYGFAIPNLLNLSNFDFEDQTIELLERYNILTGREHLTPPIVAEAYAELGSVAVVAEKFGVTATAIYKQLKKAGVDTSGHLKKGKLVATEDVVAMYQECGSIKRVAAHFGIDPSTVRNRLIKSNVEIVPTNAKQYASPELIEAFRRTGSINQAAKQVGLGRHAARKRLLNSGIDTSRHYEPKIKPDELQAAYEQHNGDIAKVVETVNHGRGWVDVYRALDDYGYLTSERRPITSAMAAAAYYKFGNSIKAAELLGTSSSYISRLSKKGRYISKYKQPARATA